MQTERLKSAMDTDQTPCLEWINIQSYLITQIYQRLLTIKENLIWFLLYAKWIWKIIAIFSTGISAIYLDLSIFNI